MPGGNSPVYEGLKMAGVRSGFGDDMIRIGAVKFAADGSASERTMYMSTPYEGTDDHGILTMTQDAIYEAVDDAVAPRFSRWHPCEWRPDDRHGDEQLMRRR